MIAAFFSALAKYKSNFYFPSTLSILSGIFSFQFSLVLPAIANPANQAQVNFLRSARLSAQPYIIITPNYPRPNLAPDVSYILPYQPGQTINLPLIQPANPIPGHERNQPSQQFILPNNQFPSQNHNLAQPQYTNQLPYQFPNQVNNLPPQYFIPTPFLNSPLRQNLNQKLVTPPQPFPAQTQIIRQN